MYPPIYLEYCFYEYQRDLHHNTGFSLLNFLSDIDLIQDPGDLDHSSIFIQSRQDQVWFHCGPVLLMQELLQPWPWGSVLLVCLSACRLVRLPVYALLQFIMWTCISNISLIGTLKQTSKATWYMYALFLICRFILWRGEG